MSNHRVTVPVLLTARQAEVFLWLARCALAGYPATDSEAASHFGCRSRSAIYFHRMLFTRKGLIAKETRPSWRCFTLTSLGRDLAEAMEYFQEKEQANA